MMAMMIETNYTKNSMRGISQPNITSTRPIWYNERARALPYSGGAYYKCVWVWWSLNICIQKRWTSEYKTNHSIHIVIWIMIFNTFDTLKKMHCFIFLNYYRKWKYASDTIEMLSVFRKVSVGQKKLWWSWRKSTRKNELKREKKAREKKIEIIINWNRWKCHKFEACQQIFHFASMKRYVCGHKWRLNMNNLLVFQYL